MDKEKVEELKEKLFNKRENGWLTVDKKEDIFNFADGYINFMNNAKTEREIIKQSKKIAEENGYKNIEELLSKFEILEKVKFEIRNNTITIKEY